MKELPIDLRPLTRPVAKQKYMLCEEFTYTWATKSKRVFRIIVPNGFIFDGASVPKIFWSFIRPMAGDMMAAALVHDYIYRHNGDMPIGRFQEYKREHNKNEEGVWINSDIIIGRKYGDAIFEQIMAAAGRGWTRKIAHRAVNIGGWLSWRHHARKS
jgi:hypothetical protein